MPKTIRELADQLNVSKQTIQYHYQRLPAKNRQKDSQGTNMIIPKDERIIRDKVAKPLLANNQQIDSKETTKTNKDNNELVATLIKEVEDLKSQRDKQLATKDRQIDSLTKLIDQQQKLQLSTVTENRQLKEHVRKLSYLVESPNSTKKQQANDQQTKCRVGETDNKERIISKSWWRFWKTKLFGRL